MDNPIAGKRSKTRRLAPEELDIYREQSLAFQRKFGREMGPDDPLFFDPHADTPQFRNPDDAGPAIQLIVLQSGGGRPGHSRKRAERPALTRRAAG